MKFLLFFVWAWLFSVATTSAYDVSTTEQNKNVLLEEFTGMYCSYCPQGHVIADRLKAAQPDNVYVIAVHSGIFAIPMKGDPYFCTEFGNMLNTEFDVSSYPSGVVNRHAVNGYLVMSRGEWTQLAKDRRTEPAVVNLLAKSEYDAATRKLSVSVEGYYTGDSENEFNMLNIALIQNNIQGPQSGGGAGDAYMHQHMLRDYITENWGDTISNVRKGEYFTRSYEYTLPAQINEVEVKPEDIEIIAFVCEGKKEVLNVTGSKPVCKNNSNPLSVVVSQPNIPVKDTYGFNFFELAVENLSDKAIEEMEFDLTVNGETQQVKWQGNLSGFSQDNIRIDAFPYEMQEENAYQIILKAINATEYQSENASISGTFKAPSLISSQLKIQFKTDYNAADNRFLLKDEDGNVVKEFGPYASGCIQKFEETVDLEEGRIYCLEVSDSWADGISEGYYKIYDDSDSLVISNEQVESYGDRAFFAVPFTTGLSSQAKAEGYKIMQLKNSMHIVFGEAGLRKILICTLGGDVLVDETVYSTSHTLSLGVFRKGVYLISVLDETGIKTFKCVVA